VIEACFDKVFDTQRIYRLVLDAMARPGKLNSLPVVSINPPSGLSQYAAAAALTLLDSETGFCVLPDNQMIVDYLLLNTGAASCPLTVAEFIIVIGATAGLELSDVCRGTLISPEKGATLIIMVDRLATAAGTGSKLTLRGPGIKGEAILYISGLNKSILEAIASLNQEYPLGVDVVYVDHAGTVACVPRSSSLRWEEVS
jgi:alpha-D-ribose 1-methylphosphonate 5-triphosphate synthase subunit PhnH